jgi:hypothetical protein
MSRSKESPDPLSRFLEVISKKSTLNLLYLIVALVFLQLHVRHLNWHRELLPVINRTIYLPVKELNTSLLVAFLLWATLIYLRPDGQQQNEDNDKIRKLAFLRRLWYRISVTYFMEIVCLYLGMCLLFEKSFIVAVAGWQEPYPEVVQEAGMALIVAGIISAIYEVEHREGTFAKPVRQIKLLTERLDLQVQEANRISGYLNYRNAIQEAYGKATKRIVSISDYWIVDRVWWDQGAWTECPLYVNLELCFKNMTSSDKEEMRVVFAGDVPWPRENGSFDEPDFERFLGVIWRLVIAYKLRDQFHLRNKDTIRVVVATVPVPATIVDNEVYIFLQRFPNPEQAREQGGASTPSTLKKGPPDPLEGATGTKIAGGTDEKTAEAYDAMICSYLRHVRSAREYVEAALYYSALRSVPLTCELVRSVGQPLNQPAQFHVSHANVKACLVGLGMTEWRTWKEAKDCIVGDKCVDHALAIVTEFCQMSGIHMETFEDLRRDLL